MRAREVVSLAEFVSRGLSIEPSSTLVGETVVISVEVSNVGGQEGSHLAVFIVNGVTENEHEVSLEPEGSETVIFEYIPQRARREWFLGFKKRVKPVITYYEYGER